MVCVDKLGCCQASVPGKHDVICPCPAVAAGNCLKRITEAPTASAAHSPHAGHQGRWQASCSCGQRSFAADSSRQGSKIRVLSGQKDTSQLQLGTAMHDGGDCSDTTAAGAVVIVSRTKCCKPCYLGTTCWQHVSNTPCCCALLLSWVPQQMHQP
jgi:hypothetical protein